MVKYDLVVIGGGPGGYVAAIKAAQLGLSVAIIERAELGGICLNWGCIPTKALLRSAEVYNLAKHHLDEFGVKADNVSFDFDKIIKRSRAVASKLSDGIKFLMKKNKIHVIIGNAKLGKNKEISIDGTQTIAASHIIIATGARARVLSGFEPDNNRIWSYREAMTPDICPKSLLVVGSGAIGVEFASFYNALGADVTIAEALPQILPAEDNEIAAIARKEFEKRNIKILTDAKLEKIEKMPNGVKTYINGAGYEFDRVIMAVGIVPNNENLGLENYKIKLSKSGHIETNQFMETDEPTIYAIGDIVTGPWLAHKASHEGVVAATHIASKIGKATAKDIHIIKKGNIPACTYSTPQIASIGLSEEKAGTAIKIGRFPYSANGKAIAMGESSVGLVKVIYCAKTGELLGAHIIGTEATEMISAYVVGKQMEATESDFMQTIFPHPTLSEMIHEATLDAYGIALHI